MPFACHVLPNTASSACGITIGGIALNLGIVGEFPTESENGKTNELYHQAKEQIKNETRCVKGNEATVHLIHSGLTRYIPLLLRHAHVTARFAFLAHLILSH